MECGRVPLFIMYVRKYIPCGKKSTNGRIGDCITIQLLSLPAHEMFGNLESGLPDFLGTKYKNGEKYSKTTTKYTKWL
jgi:hypothetical protein